MRLLTLLPLSLSLLSGCASTSLTGASSAAAPAVSASAGAGVAPTANDQSPSVAPGQWLGGLALPPGSSIRADQSLIIGAGDNWVGRAALNAGRDADAAYRFFLDNLPVQGWAVVAAVRGRQSLLVMTRQERTLTIEISDPMIGSPEVHLTMAPRNAAVMAPRKP